MAKRKSPTTAKPHWNMRNAELQQEREVFEKAPLGVGTPLTEEQALEWERLRVGKRRPPKKHVKVLLSLDYQLLIRADAFAKKRRVTRSGLVEYALEWVLESSSFAESAAEPSASAHSEFRRYAEAVIRQVLASIRPGLATSTCEDPKDLTVRRRRRVDPGILADPESLPPG